jgi:hypothetical protein
LELIFKGASSRRFTSRDYKIIDFIHEFKAVDSSQIARIFCSGQKQALRTANRLLGRYITNPEETEIYRQRISQTDKFIYYVGKPVQLWHKLLVSEFYTNTARTDQTFFGNFYFKREFSIFGLKSDGFIEINRFRKKFFFFLEIQLSHLPPDIRKYEKLIGQNLPWKDSTGRIIFPRIVVVSPTKWDIRHPKFKTFLLDPGMGDF